jgi:hypothetical protein
MARLNAASAKQASKRTRIPFGVPTLDSRFGGIPSGSAGLLCGSPDAGVDAFAYTTAAQSMIARHHPGFYKGKLPATRETLPDQVTYVALNRDLPHVLHEMDEVLSSRQFNVLVESMDVVDYSDRFADAMGLTGVARDAATGEDRPAAGAGDAGFAELLADVTGTVSDAAADGDLVLIDSVTELERAKHCGLDWADALRFLVGLRRAAADTDGLVLASFHRRPDSVRSGESVNTALHGCLYFYTNDEGQRARKTMRVGSFRGSLSKRHEVVYDTQVTNAGFKVKSTRNI